MKYLTITTPDVNNGDGCRVTLWIPGCKRGCKGCQNPHTHNYNQGLEFEDTTYEFLVRTLSYPYIQGLTISGGDPLMQSDKVLGDLKYLIQRLKTDLPDKDIWLYTGYYIDDLTPKQIDVVDLCDVVVDGPYIEDLQDVTLPFRGSSNQNIWKIEPNELNVTLFPDIL